MFGQVERLAGRLRQRIALDEAQHLIHRDTAAALRAELALLVGAARELEDEARRACRRGGAY